MVLQARQNENRIRRAEKTCERRYSELGSGGLTPANRFVASKFIVNRTLHIGKMMQTELNTNLDMESRDLRSWGSHLA